MLKEKIKSRSRSVGLANYDLFVDDLSGIDLDEDQVINTLNPHSFYIAENDKSFKAALEHANVLLPDGVGIVWAARFLKRQHIRRISGMDLFLHLLAASAASDDALRRRIFFLGASPEALLKIEKRIHTEYPSLEVCTYSPPYKEVFSIEDNEEILAALRQFKPYLLFIGMTAPKQEKWVYENQSSIPATVICSIGAVFDYYAGTIKRPGRFWINIGLEWLIRFLREPRRLWKRNLISGPFFVYRMIQLKLNS